MSDTLKELARRKLNITWDDEDTDSRLENIITDAIPNVANMVGLKYDYEKMEAIDGCGRVFDFTLPSVERIVLLNFIAYEWNHQANLFRANYWEEIAACRQKHALEAVRGGEEAANAENSE